MKEAAITIHEGSAEEALEPIRRWFESQGWTPHEFQQSTWRAFLDGQEGLIHVATGAGKTYAAFLGALSRIRPGAGLQLVYLTPLRAVARDIERALRRPVDDLGLGLRVETRTGDTSSSLRARQKRSLPEILLTTPESLSLLLSYEDAPKRMSTLRAVIVDEWHELLSTKRGTQTELALARLRRLQPGIQTWGLSATIANLDGAMRALLGDRRSKALLIEASMPRPIHVESLIPKTMENFPWSGHLGLRMLEPVLERLDVMLETTPGGSVLVFTNTRSQAERWYRAILDARPSWQDLIALHHGSIDRESRTAIENSLKTGSCRLVVATSSLDLGVDFSPVDHVIQVGSPRTVARLVQRAGRSGHRPGEACRILCVPTHALELFEIAAAREAIAQRQLEPRLPQEKPLDVLCQHLVTCALGGGFEADELFDEIRTTHAYRSLTREEFDWALDLVEKGGECLRAYSDYQRVVKKGDLYVVETKRVAQLHRLSIGTITSDATVDVQFRNGKRLGTIEESFIAKLKPGDTFTFGGRNLSFVAMRDSKVVVKSARSAPEYVPRWAGGRLPLSQNLADACLALLEARRAHRRLNSPEIGAIETILDLQERLSAIPGTDSILAEEVETRDGHHLFFFPFAGRLVHEGLGALLAYRWTRKREATFSVSVNDYGIELCCAEPFPFRETFSDSLFDEENLLQDIVDCVNMAELGRRQFRDIARVSMLVYPSFPGMRKTGRQLQTSAGLLYDVFRNYEPGNRLLDQAQREVLESQFEQVRLVETLRRLRTTKWRFTSPPHPTPFAFPLIIERIGARLSNETLKARVERMTRSWS